MDNNSKIGVNYSNVSNSRIEDKRFTRERETWKKPVQENPMSSTFDALIRMEAGLEGRTIMEKIADPNRPTWDQYKKENEDKVIKYHLFNFYNIIIFIYFP